jgi:hypothetical protein
MLCTLESLQHRVSFSIHRGSVGMTFVMWIVGALVAAAGTAVYVEFGTVRFTLRFVGRAPHFALV